MNLQTKSTSEASPALLRWGGIASLLMAAALLIAPVMYLVGNLREAFGALGYSVADLLYGPVFGASLVTVMAALRQRMGQDAPIRMSLANKAAVLAAGAFVLMACIRAANRHYHLIHPGLHLEESSTVLIVWATLVAGVNGAAWHFLGWAYLLVGWAGWTSRGCRGCSVLCMSWQVRPRCWSTSGPKKWSPQPDSSRWWSACGWASSC